MKATSEEIYSKSITCDFLFMVNSIVAVLLTVCETFSHTEIENISHTEFWSETHGGERPAILHRWKINSELQFCRWQYESIFICLAVVASEICAVTEIL